MIASGCQPEGTLTNGYSTTNHPDEKVTFACPSTDGETSASDDYIMSPE